MKGNISKANTNDGYTAGNGIDISATNVISAKIDEANGLSVGENGIALATATASASGAMSSADKRKLDEIDAYTKTQSNTLFSNAVRETVSGEGAVGVDVSPLLHDVDVSVRSTNNNVSDYSNVIVKRFGGNIANIPDIETTGQNYSMNNYIQWYIDLPVGTTITVSCDYKGSGTGGAKEWRIKLRDDTTVKLFEFQGTTVPSRSSYTHTKTVDFTASDVHYSSFYFIQANQDGNYAKNITVNIGNKDLGYMPYSEPVTYTANADGTVSGVKSLSPYMTLIPYAEKMEVSFTFNKDVNTYFNELFFKNGKRAITIGNGTSAPGDNALACGYGWSTLFYSNLSIAGNTTTISDWADNDVQLGTVYLFTSLDGVIKAFRKVDSISGSTVQLNYYISNEQRQYRVERIEGVALGVNSISEGEKTTASVRNSHAGGEGTLAAGECQFVIGKYNRPETWNGHYFIIGKGTSRSDRSNMFRVSRAANSIGAFLGEGSYATTGADYAEYYEWADGNPDDEDRRGLFVTLDGEKIRKATSNDDYIFGIVSAIPAVIGNAYEDEWNGRYMRDVYGAIVYETIVVPETIDEDGNIIPEHEEIRPVINPDYDPTRPYTPRSQRKEWTVVGTHGQLVVNDDGTCEVNRYCAVADNGAGTKSDVKTDYRVMKRIDNTHILVVLK